MKLLIALMVLLSVTNIFTQTIQLRGRVIDFNKQPVKNVTLRFTTFGETVTTGSGEFIISIPQEVSFVEITLLESDLQILYPIDSRMAVPSDPNFVNTVIVTGNNSSNGNSLDEVLTKFNQLEDLLKNVGTTNTELNSFFEKFVELESKRLEISELQLKEKFEKQGRRKQLFSDITPFLNEYLLRVKNLKTNFEMYYQSAFISNASVDYLNSAIRLYNPVFDSINNYNNKWQEEISLAWDEVLSEKFAGSIDYMIDDIHKPYVFQLNENIKLINDVRLKNGEAETNPEELKSKVINNVSSILKNLDIRIPILETRFSEIITRMQHADLN